VPFGSTAAANSRAQLLERFAGERRAGNEAIRGRGSRRSSRSRSCGSTCRAAADFVDTSGRLDSAAHVNDHDAADNDATDNDATDNDATITERRGTNSIRRRG
jgi:hypothetical protein